MNRMCTDVKDLFCLLGAFRHEANQRRVGCNRGTEDREEERYSGWRSDFGCEKTGLNAQKHSRLGILIVLHFYSVIQPEDNARGNRSRAIYRIVSNPMKSIPENPREVFRDH